MECRVRVRIRVINEDNLTLLITDVHTVSITRRHHFALRRVQEGFPGRRRTQTFVLVALLESLVDVNSHAVKVRQFRDEPVQRGPVRRCRVSHYDDFQVKCLERFGESRYWHESGVSRTVRYEMQVLQGRERAEIEHFYDFLWEAQIVTSSVKEYGKELTERHVDG